MNAMSHTTSNVSEETKDVGSLLRGWRAAQGLSQREAAAKIGTSQGRWAKWEGGHERPGPRYLMALHECSGGALDLQVLIELAPGR